MITKNIIHGIFSDEVPLIEACKKLRSSGIRINEVYTPFPLHGIDPIIGLLVCSIHCKHDVANICSLFL